MSLSFILRNIIIRDKSCFLVRLEDEGEQRAVLRDDRADGVARQRPKLRVGKVDRLVGRLGKEAHRGHGHLVGDAVSAAVSPRTDAAAARRAPRRAGRVP